MTTLIGLFHQVVIEERLFCVEQIDEIDEPSDIAYQGALAAVGTKS